jgi:uncharacterized RDD family membrane protein YckC
MKAARSGAAARPEAIESCSPGNVDAFRHAIPCASDAGTFRSANLFVRFFAFVIDETFAVALAGMACAAVASVGMVLMLAGVEVFGGGLMHSVIFWVLGLAASLATYVAYFVLLETGSHQATLGKRVFGMRITSVDGGTITVLQSLGRLLVKNLLSDLILGFGFLMAVFTERKQALHDMAAGTVVVEE